MNEILAIIFLCFGLLILFRKIMLSVMQPILDSSNLRALGFIAIIIGLLFLYIVDLIIATISRGLSKGTW